MSLKFANPQGSLLALSSSVIWATYWILNLRDERDNTVKMFMNFIFGFVYTALAVALTSDITLPPAEGLVGSVYVGLFEMGITFLIWLNALKYSETTAQIANLIYLAPFISLLVIYFAVGEEILPSTVVGLVLIIGGILLTLNFDKKT
ncbi:DMT family transporter [Archaeoglobus veneficus]|uniref:DMT family transporter n=1 Tax=Archaeoglobus veneficus TaxID=58290 RepID=UPI0022B29745|nr:DMT family transporter [Archaeoglobus veneficus]